MLGGSAATLHRKMGKLNHTMMPAAPTKNTMFEQTASSVSAVMRWTSAASLLIRETTSPKRLRVQNRGEQACK